MKTIGLALSGLATAAFVWLAAAGAADFYTAALVSGFVFFRLATGTFCPLVWLLTKLGAKGLACPVGVKKRP